MKKSGYLLLLALVTVSANAKNKIVPLSESTASTLEGKSLVVTRHAKPGFTAMTAGKAMFGLAGALAMVSAGNKIINDNQVEDPADILQRELAPALAKRYGLVLKPATTPIIEEVNPKKIASTQTDTDYILDIRSAGWMWVYYPSDWNNYAVYYMLQLQLIDAKSGVSVSKLNCNPHTKKDPHPPTKDAMLADGAALLKDMTQSLGWECLKLTKEQFRLTDSDLAATPEQYVDVLGKYAATHPAPAGGTTPTAAALETSPAAADAAVTAAEPTEEPAANADEEPMTGTVD
ncbi:MAG: hypothetical protein WC213_00560 [Arenimonas sp.]|jgi:hypothetical protein